uniref:DEP domain-containing protein n=1 Tax=Syphacia muris TaxID=451379 RepID=A0A0N5ANJ5_9BILA
MDGKNRLKEDKKTLLMQTPKPRKCLEEINDAEAFEGRFKATRMWNGVMKRFRSGMPLKRHRKLMFSYEDSFTGREAVDFLMNELPKFYSAEKRITRSNCHMLLKKFIDAGLFLSVRAKENEVEDAFRENEVYRFSDIPLEKVAATPILVRRASSFNERPTFESNSCEKDYSKIAMCKMDNLRTFDKNVFDPLLVNRSPLLKSRRLSSSHGNLPSMVSPKICTSVMVTPHLTLHHSTNDNNDGKAADAIDKFSQYSKNSVTEGDENLSSLDDVISQLQKVGENPVNMNTSLTIRSFGKVLQSSSDDLSPVLSTEHKIRFHGETHTRISPIRVKKESFDEDEKLLRSESLDGIIGSDFSSSDVKWNCEKIGLKGIVKANDENDDLSTYLIAMMRYLTRWPFDQKFVEKVAVYPGIERNVFENVCEHFAKTRPILSHSIARSILAVVNHFKSRDNDNFQVSLSDGEVGSKIELSTPDTSAIRFDKMLQNRIDSSNRDVNRNLKEDKSSTMLCDFCNNDYESRNASNAEYMELPVQGSSSRDKIEVAMSSSQYHSSPNSCISNDVHKNISQEDASDLLEAVALILLTLSPLVRRRLHYLLRFMEKICKNHCLRLSLSRENRFVVLERLSGSVLSPTTSISPTQCLHIVTFLVDNQSEVFSVPDSFKEEVENLLHQRNLNVRISRTGNQREAPLNETPKQYCKPIRLNEYDRQKQFGMEVHLLRLLDNIVDNETITVEERKRQLRKFKRTYPEIYSKRFSTPKPRKPRTPSFLDRLKTFNFRQ